MTSTKKKGGDRNTTEPEASSVAAAVVVVQPVTPLKVKSTGCGPSPPRDTPETDSKDHHEDLHPADVQEDMEVQQTIQEVTVPVRKISTSVGTSPPPQSAGTQVIVLINTNIKRILLLTKLILQTYDFLPLKKEPAVAVATEPEEEENSTKNKYRRSQSVSTQGTSKNRPMSRHSFSSETQSLPPTPPLSPNTMRRRMDKYDIPDDTMSVVSKRDSRQGGGGGHNNNQFDNYRSVNDLMRPDLYSSRRSSFFDYPRGYDQQRVRNFV